MSHLTGDQSDRPVPFYGERTMSYDQSIRLPASSSGEQQRYHRKSYLNKSFSKFKKKEVTNF